MSAQPVSTPFDGADAKPAARQRRAQWILFGVMVAALIVAPFFLYPVFLMKLLCFALFACAFNLLTGHTGLLSFGHAAFFGVGAYAGGWIARTWGLSTELSILGGGAVGAVLGLVFATIAIRRQGLQFALITLALAQVVYFVCEHAEFTGGENGLQQIPRGKLFGLIDLSGDMAMYIFVAALFLLGFAVIYRILHSPTGQVLRAIRFNEARAVSLGYSVDLYKILVFTLSAALSGVAGATKSIVFGVATLTDVHFAMSGEVLLMAILGGLGTMFGPVIGALLVLVIESLVAPYGAWSMVAQGALFIVCVLMFSEGLAGELAARLKSEI
jgi:branched-chain amino acid transport system permease protein